MARIVPDTVLASQGRWRPYGHNDVLGEKEQVVSVRAVLAGWVAVLLTAGCGITVPGAQTAPPQTCEELLALKPADRNQWGWADLPARSFYYEDYAMPNASPLTAWVEYCGRHPGAGRFDPSGDGSCETFMAATDDTKKMWLEALSVDSRMQVHPELTIEKLAGYCESPWMKDPWVQPKSAGDDFITSVVTAGSQFSSYGEWTTTSKLGYKTRYLLALGKLSRGDNPWADSASTIVARGFGRLPDPLNGAHCDYNPARDAVIPFAMVLAPLNQEPEDPVAISIGLDGPPGFGSETVTVTLEMYNETREPNCQDLGESGHAEAGWTWSDTTNVAGAQVKRLGNGFVIVRNYFTPRHPEGAKAELAEYALTGLSATAEEGDPIVEATDTVLALTDALNG